MTFTGAVGRCLSNYATFQGRSARSEFWYYCLFSPFVLVAAMIADNIAHTTFGGGEPLGWIYLFCALGNLFPLVSVTVRRLHDTDHSGWWYWLLFVPVAGPIVLLVWFCTKGTAGENRFGSDPLTAEPLTGLPEGSFTTPPLGDDITDQLSKIAKLYADGALTEEEFRSLKAKLIVS